MKKTIGKRLLSGVTSVLLAASSFGFSAFSDDDSSQSQTSSQLIYPARNDVLTSGVGQTPLSVPTDAITLLAGTDDTRGIIGDTLEETIENYKNKYLLGVAADFSVYLHEDFIVYDSDAEGRVAIGGNYVNRTKYDSYAVGKGDYAHRTPLEDLLNNDGFAHAIIGGSMERGEPANGNYDGSYAYGKALLNGLYYNGDGTKSGEAPGDGYDGTKASMKLVLQAYEDDSQYAGWTPKQKYDDFVSAVNPEYPLTNRNSTNGTGDTVEGRILWDGYGYGYAKLGASQTYFAKLLDFDSRFDFLNERSSDMKTLGDKMTQDTAIYMSTDPSEPDTIILEYTGSANELECVFFNMTEDQWDMYLSAATVKFVGIPSLPASYGENGRPVTDNEGNMTTWEYAYIIVNVGAEAKVDDDSRTIDEKHLHIVDPSMNGGSNKTYINGIDISKKSGDDNTNNYHGVTSLLYNFYALEENDNLVLGNNFSGTIFAPNADVIDEWLLNLNDTGIDDKNMHGHLSGALIANSFEGATEFGYRPFDGPVMGISVAKTEYAVTLCKVDSVTSEPLDGASFDLYMKDTDEESDTFGEYVKVKEGITADPEILIEGLTAGEYYLEETVAPDGYKLPTGEDAKTYFTIEDNGKVRVSDIGTGEYKYYPTEYKVGETDPDGTPVPENAATQPDKYIPAGFTSDVAFSNISQIALNPSNGGNTTFSDIVVTVYYADGSKQEYTDSQPSRDVNNWLDLKSALNIDVSKPVAAITVQYTAPSFVDNWANIIVQFSDSTPQKSTSLSTSSTPTTVTVLGTVPSNTYYVVAEEGTEKDTVDYNGYTVYATKGSEYKVTVSSSIGKITVDGESTEFNPFKATLYQVGDSVYKVSGTSVTKVSGADVEGVKLLTGVSYSYTDASGKAVSGTDGYVLVYPSGSSYKTAVAIPVLTNITVENDEDEETEYAAVSIEKVWKLNGVEADAPEGVDSITVKVTIYYNGVDVTDTYAEALGLGEGNTVTLTADGEWKWTSPDEVLVKSAEDDKYTIKVTEVDVPDDYVVTYTNNDGEHDKVTITNNKETVDLTVNKTWVVADADLDVTHPASITVDVQGKVKVKENDEVVFEDQFTLTPENGDWTKSMSIKGLPKTYKGETITYEVLEVVPNDYVLSESSSAGNVFNFTNKYKAGTVNISGTKTWVDDDNYFNSRDEITVVLYANGEKYKEVSIPNDGTLSYAFNDLPKFDANGELINYTIKETNIPDGYEASYDGYNITNTYEFKQGTTSLSGEKKWVDDNNYFNSRDDITVVLLADGKEVDRVTVTAKDGWKYSFTDLKKYNPDKSEIKYTVKEENVPDGYTSSVSGNDITNTYNFKQETTSVSGEKKWVDNNNSGNTRPGSITVNLYADGKKIDSKIVTANDGWKYSFTDLKKYNPDKTEIKYTIDEEAVSGYTKKVDGYNITNTLEEEEEKTTSVNIDKRDIANDEEVIGAELVITDKDGKEVDSWTSDGTVHTVEGLVPGEEYTLHEKHAPEGYDEISTDITFTVDEDGNVTIVDANDEDYELSNDEKTLIVNDSKKSEEKEEKTTSVNIDKRDIANDEEVIGAELVITDKDGKEVDSWISDGTVHTVEGLVPGEEYTLHEKNAPEGYDEISTDITFTVDEDGNVTIVDANDDDYELSDDEKTLIVNDSKKSEEKEEKTTSVNIDKRDIANDEEVIGAELVITDKDGKVVDSWISDGTVHTVEGLVPGEEYTLHETNAPEGYDEISTDITFTVDEDGNVTIVNAADEDYELSDDEKTLIVNDSKKSEEKEEKTTSVNIDKRDIANDEEVIGAELVITDKDGNVVDSWISDGTVHTVTGLIPGEEYTLTEKNAPEGYDEISTDITFTVDEDGNVTIVNAADEDYELSEDAKTLIVNDTKKSEGKVDEDDDNKNNDIDTDNDGKSDVEAGGNTNTDTDSDNGSGSGTGSDSDSNNGTGSDSDSNGGNKKDDVANTGSAGGNAMMLGLIAAAAVVMSRKKK